MNTIRTVLLFLGFATLPLTGIAEDAVGPSPASGRYWVVSLGLGSFNPDGEGRLQNRSGQYALAIDVSHQFNPHFAFAFDIWAARQRYDTPATVMPPFLGTVDGRAELNTGGMSVIAKLGYPLGSIEPYAGAGIGYFLTEAYVSGAALGLPAEYREDDWELGKTLLAGIDARIGNNWSLGIQYRKTYLKGNFGALSYYEEVDVGGDSLLLMGRWHWPAAGASY